MDFFGKEITEHPESEYSPSRPWCPRPEYWHTFDNMGTEVEVLEFLYGVVRCLQPEFVVETGTYLGWGAYAIGKALQRNGHGMLVTLETHLPHAEAAGRLCCGLPVEVQGLSSMDYVPTQDIDFAWFDSAPSLRALEFRRYFPYLKGLVAFHDTYFPEVSNGISELEKDGLIKPLYFPTPRGMCFGQAVKE